MPAQYMNPKTVEEIEGSKRYTALMNLQSVIQHLKTEEIDAIADLVRHGVFSRPSYTTVPVKNIFGDTRMVLQYDD